MGFPRLEYWSGLPFTSPGDLPNPGTEPKSPALVGRFFTTEPPGKPPKILIKQIRIGYIYIINILKMMLYVFILWDRKISTLYCWKGKKKFYLRKGKKGKENKPWRKIHVHVEKCPERYNQYASGASCGVWLWTFYMLLFCDFSELSFLVITHYKYIKPHAATTVQIKNSTHGLGTALRQITVRWPAFPDLVPGEQRTQGGCNRLAEVKQDGSGHFRQKQWELGGVEANHPPRLLTPHLCSQEPFCLRKNDTHICAMIWAVSGPLCCC